MKHLILGIPLGFLLFYFVIATITDVYFDIKERTRRK